MKRKIEMSIIIPTFNSEVFLDSCLKAIKNQSFLSYEVIIVDQQSNDKTIAIAKSYKAHVISVPRLKFYSPPSKSRNIGAKLARGLYLYHMDSDMRISKKLLSEAVTIFQKNKDIGALMVHEEDKPKGFFSKCKALERYCYRGNDSIDSCRIVRKSIFTAIGGYDEKISSGEDFAIQQKYKKVTKISYCKNIIYQDLTHLTFVSMIRKKYNYGKTAKQYFKKSNESGLQIILKEFHMYVNNYKLFLLHPIIGLGMIFLKVSEILAGSLGYIIGNYIKVS